MNKSTKKAREVWPPLSVRLRFRHKGGLEKAAKEESAAGIRTCANQSSRMAGGNGF